MPVHAGWPGQVKGHPLYPRIITRISLRALLGRHFWLLLLQTKEKITRDTPVCCMKDAQSFYSSQMPEKLFKLGASTVYVYNWCFMQLNSSVRWTTPSLLRSVSMNSWKKTNFRLFSFGGFTCIILLFYTLKLAIRIKPFQSISSEVLKRIKMFQQHTTLYTLKHHFY